jgi:hypothetical protein
MNRFYLFLIRIFVGAGFAVLISRVFFQRIDPVTVAGIGIFLVGMAYVLEYFRQRKN